MRFRIPCNRAGRGWPGADGDFSTMSKSLVELLAKMTADAVRERLPNEDFWELITTQAAEMLQQTSVNISFFEGQPKLYVWIGNADCDLTLEPVVELYNSDPHHALSDDQAEDISLQIKGIERLEKVLTTLRETLRDRLQISSNLMAVPVPANGDAVA
jgi:hypothetical protein